MMRINALFIALDDGEAPRMLLELRRNEYFKKNYMVLVIKTGESEVRLRMTEDQGFALEALNGIQIKDCTND